MLRKIVMGFLLILFFLIQTTLVQGLALASITPNLLLILTFVSGFMRGKKSGIWVGFFAGLLIDIFYGQMIGFNALIYMYIGYLNGFFHKLFYDEDITLPLVLVCGSDFLYGFSVYVLRFLLRNRLDLPFYMMRIIIPELIYTVVFAIILYRPLLKLHRFLEEREKRSANKFV